MHFRDKMRKTCLLVLLAFSALAASAQKERSTTDFGIFLGGSYYIGDLNPVRHFALTQPAGGVHFRYNIDSRFAGRANLWYGTVQGNDARSESFSQQQRNLNFKSKIMEFSAIMEFNFMEYKIGSEKHPFSPFAFLGVGLFKFEPQGNLGGNWVNLQPLTTEGQDRRYKLGGLSIPFGVGVKVNLAKRLGLGIEWGMRKTFTDYIDDVHGTYADPGDLPNSLAVLMADRSAIPEQQVTNVGRQRGNPATKDWYSFTGITLNFKLNLKSEPCYAR